MSLRPSPRQLLRTGALASGSLAIRSLAPRPLGPLARPRRAHDGVERLGELFLETRRYRAPEVLAAELRQGVPVEQAYAAIQWAAARHVAVHHCIYVLDPLYRMARRGPREARFAAPYLALDAFKQEQHDGPRLGWGAPRGELAGRLFDADEAAGKLDAALEAMDQDVAERAFLSIAREKGPDAAFHHLWPYAARDWSFIGHRAIAVVSAWRLGHGLDWPKAEVTLRAAVGGLFARDGEDGSEESYPANLERARGATWTSHDAPGNAGYTLELVALLRAGEVDAVCELAARGLESGQLTPRSTWDAAHLGAAELMWRHVSLDGLGGLPLHSRTALNALHTVYTQSEDDVVQRLTLLQALAWVAEFTRVRASERALVDRHIDQLGRENGAGPAVEASEASERVLATLQPSGYPPSTRASSLEALPLLFQLARQHEDTRLFEQRALQLLATSDSWNAHHAKFLMAVFEDARRVSPLWRPHVLSSSVHWQHGSHAPKGAVVLRAERAR